MQNGRARTQQSGARRRGKICCRESKYRASAKFGAPFPHQRDSDNGVVQKWIGSDATGRRDGGAGNSKIPGAVAQKREDLRLLGLPLPNIVIPSRVEEPLNVRSVGDRNKVSFFAFARMTDKNARILGASQ